MTRRQLHIVTLFLSLFASQVRAGSADSDLYYAEEKAFNRDNHYELRLGVGYDFSNPYLNILSLQAGGYYLIDSSFAVGLEGTGFSSWNRGTTNTLQSELPKQGLTLDVLTPQYRLAAAVRVTPVSGLVNLFSKKVIRADVNVIGRAGMIQYKSLPAGPLLGVGLETQLGFTPQFGMFTAISFDFEKPGNRDWQQRTGFLLGPSYRF